jgi:hypothetical protein
LLKNRPQGRFFIAYDLTTPHNSLALRPAGGSDLSGITAGKPDYYRNITIHHATHARSAATMTSKPITEPALATKEE